MEGLRHSERRRRRRRGNFEGDGGDGKSFTGKVKATPAPVILSDDDSFTPEGEDDAIEDTSKFIQDTNYINFQLNYNELISNNPCFSIYTNTNTKSDQRIDLYGLIDSKFQVKSENFQSE